MGQRLCELRVALGFRTQADFADWLQMPYPTLSDYERGARRISIAVHAAWRRFATGTADRIYHAGDTGLPGHIQQGLRQTQREPLGTSPQAPRRLAPAPSGGDA